MDNIMDIKLGGGNNTMKPFSFYWMAEFKDGTIINQYDDNGKEHFYQEIKDKFQEITWFYLYNKNNPKNIFIIDLLNGFIYINKIVQDFKEKENTVKENIRLIYFRTRRNKITIFHSKCTNNQEIHYNLGFQYNDKSRNNRQIILQIDEEGNWILEG